MMASFEHAYFAHPHAEWYYKADDDTYADPTAIAAYLDRFPAPHSTPYYVGAWIESPSLDPEMRGCTTFLDCSAFRDVPAFDGYARGGPGYVLSREALRLLLLQHRFGGGCALLLEDLTVGWCLFGLGVPLNDVGDDLMPIWDVWQGSATTDPAHAAAQLAHVRDARPLAVHKVDDPAVMRRFWRARNEGLARNATAVT